MKKFSVEDVLRAVSPDSVPLIESLLGSRAKGGPALYLVGGPVRDLLLKRAIRDVDLLVESEELSGAASWAHSVAPDGSRVVVHERFGTVRVEWSGASVDLATTRQEIYSRPGALPRVEAAGLAQDLERRDFTVNALALPLAGGRREEKHAVVDLAGGLEDLRAQQLRVFHERSFHDDPTRALRAARLSVRLGFAVSRRTASYLRAALRDGAFGAVSGDRLGREVRLLFGEADAGVSLVDMLRRLDGWGVLGVLEPGLSLHPESLLGLRRLGRLASAPPWRGPRGRLWVSGLCVWLAPLAPALRRRTLRRFGVRGDVATRIAEFPKLRDASLRALGRARGRGAVDRVLGDFDEERLLALFACAQPAVRRRVERWAAEDRTRRAPVAGGDLVELGVSGASVGRTLARIREAYLDGDIVNREEGLALAREIVRRARPAPARRRRTKD